MSEWDQCPWFLILSHCLPRLNHLGISSGWQVINHCSHATFPEALWTKPYDNPKIGSLKTWSSPMWAWGLLLPLYQAFQWKCLTGPPLDSFWMPLAPCLPSLSLSEESRFRLFPRTRPPPPAWRVHSQAGGKGPRFERAGALKKMSFPFPVLIWSVDWKMELLSGGEPWGEKELAPLCLLMTRTFWWIGVWYSVTSRGWWFKEKAFFFHVLFSRLLQWVYRLQWVALLFNRKLRKTWRTFLVGGNDLLILRNTSDFCTFKIQV